MGITIRVNYPPLPTFTICTGFLLLNIIKYFLFPHFLNSLVWYYIVFIKSRFSPSYLFNWDFVFFFSKLKKSQLSKSNSRDFFKEENFVGNENNKNFISTFFFIFILLLLFFIFSFFIFFFEYIPNLNNPQQFENLVITKFTTIDSSYSFIYDIDNFSIKYTVYQKQTLGKIKFFLSMMGI